MKIVKVTSEECLNIANHQKKVIDRLSRKIQRLRQQTTKHDVKEIINLVKFKDKYVNQQLQQRINKAIEILECSNNMFSERALAILKGENNGDTN